MVDTPMMDMSGQMERNLFARRDRRFWRRVDVAALRWPATLVAWQTDADAVPVSLINLGSGGCSVFVAETTPFSPAVGRQMLILLHPSADETLSCPGTLSRSQRCAEGLQVTFSFSHLDQSTQRRLIVAIYGALVLTMQHQMAPQT